MSIRRAVVLFTVCALGLGLAGCSPKTLDPGQIGRFRPTPAVNVILNSLGVAEETPVAWENAQDPQPSDVVTVKEDYALQPGDLVRVSIFELYQEGVPLVNDYTMSETGKISVPDVGVIQAAGLTERHLEDQIKQILSPGVLRNPSVTVTLLDSQQRTFSILGNAVTRPSRYVIPRSEYRLMDALATAGAQMQFNVSNIYVARRTEMAGESGGTGTGGIKRRTPELDLVEPGTSSRTDDRGQRTDNRGQRTVGTGRGTYPSSGIPEPSEPAQQGESEREMLDLIAPHAQSSWPQSTKVVGAVTPSTSQDEIRASVLPRGFRALTGRGRGDAKRDESQSGTRGVLAAPGAPEVSSLVEFGNANMGTEAQEVTPVPAASKPQARTEWIFRDGKWVQVTITGQGPSTPNPAWGSPQESRPAGAPGMAGKSAAASAQPGGIEWTLRDGQWAPRQKGVPPAVPPPVQVRPSAPIRPPEMVRPRDQRKLPMDQEWEQAIQTRLIRIPADKLLAGNPRYNIIIKPGDTIHVPVDVIGEFAITGNVNRSGYIDITGRPMTLKMAIAAAGGLGPLANPKNVEVIRRIGTAREEIVMVNLDKIASGEQPDFFIKPNDLINVGTDVTARWKAVLRNAFRAAYGFGFVYDRNFADIDYGTGFPWFHNY
ncbi:MAG: polysaccharide biosynthesis/export family protein [Planctomycetes bacterium]|nr:polysaccharide biosynthesis/export family protein [Planctomycetota bacterium]